MVAELKEKNNNYYCSNCMMQQPIIKPNCVFCGNYFTNYESVLIKNTNQLLGNKTKKRADKI